MSKYYLFSGDDYYPLEGVRDLAGKFETIEQAKLAANIDANWHQITNVELEILRYYVSKFQSGTGIKKAG